MNCIGCEDTARPQPQNPHAKRIAKQYFRPALMVAPASVRPRRQDPSKIEAVCIKSSPFQHHVKNGCKHLALSKIWAAAWSFDTTLNKGVSSSAK